MSQTTHEMTQQLAELLKEKNWMLTIAESCTGGLISAACTDLAGSSAWFDRGFVTYSNDAKREMLGIAEHTLLEHGAVSEHTVEAMALGALKHSYAHIAVAVSGIAGPSGGSPGKPVGMVCFSWMSEYHQPRKETIVFEGDRSSIRAQAVDYALNGLIKLLKEDK